MKGLDVRPENSHFEATKPTFVTTWTFLYSRGRGIGGHMKSRKRSLETLHVWHGVLTWVYKIIGKDENKIHVSRVTILCYKIIITYNFLCLLRNRMLLGLLFYARRQLLPIISYACFPPHIIYDILAPRHYPIDLEIQTYPT